MRKLLILLLLAAGFWSGYWVIGSRLIESRAQAWFATAAQQGIRAQMTALDVRGFPNRFDLAVEGVQIADPARGFGWQAPFVQVFAMTWKPWHLIAVLPPDQVVMLPDQSLTVLSTELMASLRARPSTDLALADVRLSGQALAVTSDLGWTVRLGQGTIALRDLPDLGPTAYTLGLNLTDLAPDPAFLAALRTTTIPELPPSDLPDTIAALTGAATLTLSAPLNRHLTGAPFLVRADLQSLSFTWGALELSAEGMIEADQNGYAAGRITVSVTNWDRLPALLVAADVIRPDFAPTVLNGLRALAAQSPDLSVLTLPITMADGRMTFGPFPLGPAPLLLPPSG